MCPITACGHSANVILAVDTSHNLDSDKFQLQLEFLHSLAYQINVEARSRLGVVTFNALPQIQFGLEDFTNLKDLLNNMAFYNSESYRNTSGGSGAPSF